MYRRLVSSTFATALVCLLGVGDANAEEFGGIEFPHGEDSFAESVTNYELNDNTDVETGTDEPFDDPSRAIGPPDNKGVALGNAPDEGTSGELIVAFDSNRLINIEGDDLYIFEIGPQAEKSIIAISTDGEEWVDIGMIEGSTRSLDLANFPEIPDNAAYRYVRLRDFPNGKSSGGPFGGPDIDSVGAIGSIDASKVKDGRIISEDDAVDGGCACTSTNGNSDGSGAAAIGLLVLAGAFLRRRSD